MSSKAEMIGAALARAVKATTGITSAKLGGAPFRTNMGEVPTLDAGPDGGMQVRFLLDQVSTGADQLLAWTLLKPGARYARHRHRNCDEFMIVLKGRGHIDGENGEQPAGEGDVFYWPRGSWHGFNNSSNADVVLIWGWVGAGSVEASGTEMATAPP
jgi:mannose-6-phosphate isomerase-like protein (cupin superfamily)